MSEPIFNQVAATKPFTPLPQEFTPRFTVEQALQQGFQAGWRLALQEVQNMIDAQAKPTKQLTALRQELERLEEASS